MRLKLHSAVAWMLVVLAMIIPAHSSFAAPEPEVAKAHIQKLADEAIAILEESDLTLVDQEKKFGVILRQGFDIELIGRFVMGRHWRTASEEQREDFLELFGDFIVATYVPRFSNFSGETITITGTQAIDDSDVLVTTEIGRSGDRPIQTGWRVRMRETEPKIIDVMVEGLSLAVTQRDEFASVLRRQGIDGLMTIMEARTQRLAVAGT